MSGMTRRRAIKMTASTGALALGAVVLEGSAKAQDSQDKGKDAKDIKLKQSIASAKKLRATTFTATVTCTLKNSSSANVEFIEFGLSDDSGSGDPIVKTVRINNVAAGTSKSGSETFPTGIEKMLYKLKVQGDPELYSGGGLGVNVTLVELELTD